MMDMLDNANPGLKSRFDPANALHFSDYSDSELTQILTRAARKAQVVVRYLFWVLLKTGHKKKKKKLSLLVRVAYLVLSWIWLRR